MQATRKISLWVPALATGKSISFFNVADQNKILVYTYMSQRADSEAAIVKTSDYLGLYGGRGLRALAHSSQKYLERSKYKRVSQFLSLPD